ncbi:MAG: glycosyltransferase family 9 protein [Planctomycetota bacterium]
MSRSESAPSGPQRPRVLLIRPSALGDVAKTAASLAAIRRAMPDAVIHWLVSRPFAPLIAPHPALDEAVPFDRRKAGSWAGLIRRLHRARYDAVYDLQGLLRSGLFTAATRAKVRVGFADAREGAAWFYNRKHEVPQRQNAVDRMLGLLSAELADQGVDTAHPDPRLYVAKDECDAHRAWLAEQGLDAGRYAAVAPTAKWGCKRWPMERWRVIVRRLAETGRGVVVVAGPGEEDQVRSLLGGSEPGGTLWQGGVGAMAACLADAGVVLANDSAALHIGVAFDRPVVGLYGPTDPALVGPYRRPEAVVQPEGLSPGEMVGYRDRQDDDALMRRIPIDAVWARLHAVAPDAVG